MDVFFNVAKKSDVTYSYCTHLLGGERHIRKKEDEKNYSLFPNDPIIRTLVQ